MVSNRANYGEQTAFCRQPAEYITEIGRWPLLSSQMPADLASDGADYEVRDLKSQRLWCKWRRPIGYVGMLNWLRSSMGKLKALAELFEGRHFDREVIILCVRWYLRFKLSLRDLVEMMAERGLSMAHTTIMRWVQRYAPEFEKRWHRFARAVGQSWRGGENYVQIPGGGGYLYRAVDRAGRGGG